VKYLTLDLRAIAIMRMAIASVLILDLFIRLSDLEAFYSDTGAVPLNMLFQYAWNDYYISVHTISGLWTVQFMLFMFSLFCAIMLFVGYRTTLFTVLSWFMLLSLHNRNWLILQGGDDLLRMVLFWGMFLPWGKRYSCDSLYEPEKNAEKTFISVATVAYMLQISYLYTGSALLKGPEWNTEFTALYYTYSLDQITYPITKYVYYFPELLKKLSALAYYIELLVPMLFFIPVKHAWLRLAGILIIILFHVMNGFTLFIGLFPLIGIATAMGMIPSMAIDRLEMIFSKLKERTKDSFNGIAQLISLFLLKKKSASILSSWQHKMRTAVLVFLTVFVFDWNFSNLAFVRSKLSDHLRFIGYTLRLDQSWGMFAPGVFKDDGWYVIEGITADGEHLNVLDDAKELNFFKPASVVGMFKNDRWRKYSENFIFTDHSFMRGYFCNYFKRIWNEQNLSKQITTLNIIYMQELTLPDYKYSLPKKQLLWQCEE